MRRKSSPKNHALGAFISAAGKLKTIKRAGWYSKAGIADCESVADHSFRTALLVCYYALDRGLDSGKATRMALIHDLAESKIGDLMPEQKSSVELHRARERRALRALLGILPSTRASQTFLSDVKELFEARTEESKLVWQIDKLEMGIQQKEYVREGYEKKRLREFAKNLGLSASLKNSLKNYSP